MKRIVNPVHFYALFIIDFTLFPRLRTFADPVIGNTE